MDTRTQQISDQEIDNIGQIIEDKMSENARFIGSSKVDENDYTELSYNTTRPTASYVTSIDFKVDYFIETRPGISNENKLPLLSESAARDLQYVKASNLRNKHETTDEIKKIIQAGSAKRQITNTHVARHQYSCTSCNGSGNHSCSNCNGYGNNTCHKCSFGTISCFHCGGTGRSNPSQSRHTSPCAVCVGSGRRTCGDCNGTTKIRCGICYGSGDTDCVTCHSSGTLTDFYGLKYTSMFKHNMANSTFTEDEFDPLYDWMHTGFGNANSNSAISPSLSIQRIMTEVAPSIENARYLFSIKIDAMKMVLEGKYQGKNISAKFVMFDKPWVWYNSYLDEDVAEIALKASKLSSSSPSDFLHKMTDYPALKESLRNGWDREDTDGGKWAEKVHQDSLGSISPEAARPIFIAFRQCMENHEKAVVRKAFKLPLLATLLLWTGTQYVNLPWSISHGGLGNIFLVLYVFTPYFITSKMIQSSVKRRMRKETGADQQPKLGIAGRIVPIISSALFAATWYFGFQLSNVMIAGRPLF